MIPNFCPNCGEEIDIDYYMKLVAGYLKPMYMCDCRCKFIVITEEEIVARVLEEEGRPCSYCSSPDHSHEDCLKLIKDLE